MTFNLSTRHLLTILCDSQVVLIHPGLTSLIAHIRVGRMQVALEAKSTVLPAVGRLPWLISLFILQHGLKTHGGKGFEAQQVLTNIKEIWLKVLRPILCIQNQ